MLYRIRATSCTWGNTNEDEELLEEYPCLTEFGFQKVAESIPTGSWIFDENGMAKLWQEGPPKTVYYPAIKINSLEDLTRLYKAVNKELIFSEDSIEIYDTWRE